MKKIFKPVLISDEELMTVLVYETQYELMYSLARFQEFYENPMLRGTQFSRQDIQTWQPDYYIKWSGCNFPAHIPETFRLTGGEWSLDSHEEHALSCMPVGRYIVGVHLGSTNLAATLRHERAHALYSSNGQYRNKTRDLVMSYGREESPAWQKLASMGYGENVIADEIQAYAVSGWSKLGVEEYDPLMHYVRSWHKDLKLDD